MKNHTHTLVILCGNPKREKTTKLFFLHVLNNYFLYFPATTGRRLQPPSFSGYSLREAPTPQFSSYNQKEATTPYYLWIQSEGGYNHLSFPGPTTLMYKYNYGNTITLSL
jgi:hypothetical protein